MGAEEFDEVDDGEDEGGDQLEDDGEGDEGVPCGNVAGTLPKKIRFIVPIDPILKLSFEESVGKGGLYGIEGDDAPTVAEMAVCVKMGVVKLGDEEGVHLAVDLKEEDPLPLEQIGGIGCHHGADEAILEEGDGIADALSLRLSEKRDLLL